MSFVKDYIDKSHLEEEISYHREEAQYHIQQTTAHIALATDHNTRANRHLDTLSKLKKSFNVECINA